jgi:hypothetical protein
MNCHKKGRITSRARFSMLVVAMGMGLTTIAQAACYPPQSQLPQNQIQSFLKDPAGLLAGNPTPDSLSISVRDLVESDNAALPAVIQMLKSANPTQQAATGIGLAYAARACLAVDQAFAGEIQTQLGASGFGTAVTAFVSAGGQEPATASTGAGAPGATADTSGFAQVSGGSNNTPPVLPVIGSVFVNNPFTFSGGSGGAVASRNVSP